MMELFFVVGLSQKLHCVVQLVPANGSRISSWVPWMIGVVHKRPSLGSMWMLCYIECTGCHHKSIFRLSKVLLLVAKAASADGLVTLQWPAPIGCVTQSYFVRILIRGPTK